MYVHFLYPVDIGYLLTGVNYKAHYLCSHFMALCCGGDSEGKNIDKASSSCVMRLLPQISDQVGKI
jgi:hypothetical protein